MQALGVPEVQVHEPVLTLSDAAGLEADFMAVYGAFAEVRRDRMPRAAYSNQKVASKHNQV